MNGKTLKCHFCGNEVTITDVKQRYCSHCGALLINECSNYSCQMDLEPTDAYCKYCGSPSKFLNLGIVKSAKQLIPFTKDDDDLPF